MRFCGSCGAAVTSSSSPEVAEAAAEPSPPPPSPPRSPTPTAGVLDVLSSPEAVLKFTLPSLMGALVALVLAAGVCFIVAGIYYLISPTAFDANGRGGSVRLFMKAAGLLYYTVQRVPLEYHSVGGGEDTSVFFIVQPLLLSFAVFFAFYRGGRVAARRARGGFGMKVLAGALTAVPLILLAVLAPLLFPNTLQHAAGGLAYGTNDSFQPTFAGIALWCVVWPLGFGVSGACREALGRHWIAALAERLNGKIPIAGAAVRGAGAGLATLFLLGFIPAIAVIVNLLNRFDTARSTIFGSLKSTAAAGVATASVSPNLVLLSALHSMGVGFGSKGSQAAYFFPSSAVHTAQASWIWLPALIVPALATLRMGYVAATTMNSDPRRNTAAGVLAALPFSIVCWAAALILAIRLHVEVSSSGTSFGSFGLSGPGALLLPVAWGLVGGWVGALLRTARHPTSAPPPPPNTVLAEPGAGPG